MHPSRITVTASRAAITQLAAHAQQRRLVAAAISFECSDDTVNRTVRALASEGTAEMLLAAQQPLFCEPDELAAALQKHSVPADLAAAAVASIVATNSIKVKAEQPLDSQAADITTSLLVSSPYLVGIHSVRPTAEHAPAEPEPVAATNVPTHENPVADDALPPIVRHPDADTDEV